jgi:hypothetical protein
VNKLSIVLFGAAIIIAFVSWFLIIVESIGMWRFWPWVFRTGIRVFNETHSLAVPTLVIGSEVETDSGKFKAIALGICLFRFRRPRWFSFVLHTPFPIKGSVRWDGTLARVEGRIPVFTTLFLAAWLLGWTVGGFMAVFQGKEYTLGIGVTLLGWAIIAGMSVFSIPFEIRRARKVFCELQTTLQLHGA